MTKRLSPTHLQPARQKLFSFALIFLLFALGFFAFLQQYNIISGAGTSGTVSLNILGGGGRAAEEEAVPRVPREQGKLISFLLEVIPSKITVHATQFDYTLVRLRLIHHGTTPFDLAFSTNVPALKILEERVSLAPGEEKEVTLRIDTAKQGLFLGVLTINDVLVFKQLPVLIQVDYVDFRVGVDIPTASETLLPGQNLYADIIVTPLYGENLTVTYGVQDVSGHLFLEKQEVLFPSGSTARFGKTLTFSEPLPLGDYFLVVTAEQLTKRAVGGDSFSVVDSLEPQREFPTRLYAQSPWLFFLIVLLILLLHILMTWRKKK